MRWLALYTTVLSLGCGGAMVPAFSFERAVTDTIAEAKAVFSKIDHKNEGQIIHDAPSQEAGALALAAYRTQRAPVLVAFDRCDGALADYVAAVKVAKTSGDPIVAAKLNATLARLTELADTSFRFGIVLPIPFGARP